VIRLTRFRSPHTACLRTVIIAASFCFIFACFGSLAAQAPRPLSAPNFAAVNTVPAVVDRDSTCRIIYLGFVGALEPADNKYSGVVQIRDTLRGKDFPDVCAKSFSPYVWTDGRDWLLKHFPARSGVLTPAELQLSPRVILIGHSMGGWAMLSVARELRSRDIPVELTIQIDSVGISDFTVPRNVKNGAIFHANDILMFLTTKHVRLEDPTQTKLLADITVPGVNHESITRDPRIRALVMETISSLRAAFALVPIPVVAPAPLETTSPSRNDH
jgi:hypothetical protein